MFLKARHVRLFRGVSIGDNTRYREGRLLQRRQHFLANDPNEDAMLTSASIVWNFELKPETS